MKKYNFTEYEIKKIIIDYKNNLLSVYEIAKNYNVDSSVIKRILNENNVDIINGSAFSINYWIKRGLSKEDSEMKVKEFKPVYVEYWMKQGFNEDESKFKIELHLMNTERAYIYKYGEKEGKELYVNNRIKSGKKGSKRSIEYWLNMGFNEEESKNKVSEHQRKYSKDILIEKYGIDEGSKILKKRNEKWQNSLKKRIDYDIIQKQKDVRSVEHYIQKFGENYIEQYCNDFLDKLFENNKINLIVLLKSNDYTGFIDFIKMNFFYDNSIINRISKIKLFHHIFKKNSNEIKEDILKLYPIKNKNGYGTTYQIDGKILRSLGEVKIYTHLKKIGVNFEYDFEYPNQINTGYKCDFYLKNFDIYIEYAGMQNVKKTNRSKEILESYDSRLKKKKEHCLQENLKHYFSKSVDDIINFINEIYEKNNKNG